MQLNPHFLFNAFNSIATLIHTDPRAADDMVGNLSQLLRLALDSADEQEIPFRRELDFLRRYLDIEQARFGDRLRLEEDIAPDVLTAFVPTLLLQPLVENAIRHGLEPQSTPSCVRLNARRDGDRLHIEVSDNGAGLTETTTSDELPARAGIGLSNTRTRLRELYGDGQRLTLRNGDAGGCTVEIELPFHTEPLAPGVSPST
jgi:LytS/YehU family sensor histidine kinase